MGWREDRLDGASVTKETSGDNAADAGHRLGGLPEQPGCFLGCLTSSYFSS